MNILFWIILGLIAGWIASVAMRTNYSQGPVKDIVLGVLGALIGGFVMNALGAPGVTGFNTYSILVATLGAVTLIWFGRTLRGSY